MSKEYIDAVGAYFHTYSSVSLGAGLALLISIALFFSLFKMDQIKARSRKNNAQIDQDHFNDWLGAEGYVHFFDELYLAELEAHAESTRRSSMLQKSSAT